MIHSCSSYPCVVIDVLADVGNEVAFKILVKRLSIGGVSDTLTEALANKFVALMDDDLAILVGVNIKIVSGFAVSLSSSVDAMPDTWVELVMESIGMVVDAFVKARSACVLSGICVDVLTGADANVPAFMLTALGLVTISALLGLWWIFSRATLSC